MRGNDVKIPRICLRTSPHRGGKRLTVFCITGYTDPLKGYAKPVGNSHIARIDGVEDLVVARLCFKIRKGSIVPIKEGQLFTAEIKPVGKAVKQIAVVVVRSLRFRSSCCAVCR